ncbi:hypothetical protein ACHAWF_014897 [Thalassiosira exigua]
MAHRKLSRSLSRAAVLAAGVRVALVPDGESDRAENNCHGSFNAINDNGFTFAMPRSSSAQHLPLRSIFGMPRHREHALCQKLESVESQRFERALTYHRSQIASYRQKWEYKADSSATTATKTPSRSWPEDVPSNEDLKSLLHEIKYCGRSPNFRSDKDYCRKLRFRVASALLVQFDDESQRKGFEMLRALAEKGYPDAMVYYGMCLNDGRANTDPNSEAAVSWFKRVSDMYDHPQGLYELGVAFYTGEGVVEDEMEAVRLFQLASELNHPAACYMLGDCLLDGVGVEKDRGLALDLLVRAAELGHRGSRSRVMAVLEMKEGRDYGDFTDASRQTLVEHTVICADKDGQIVRRRTTLRKEIGAGTSRNPIELARRQTIVGKSRKE